MSLIPYTISTKYKNNESIKLDLNEFDFEHPSEFYEFLSSKIKNQDIFKRYSNIYDDNEINLTDILVKYNNINNDNLLLTAGSANALEYIVQRYIDKTTTVIFLTPTFNYVETIIKIRTDKIITIPIRFDNERQPLSLLTLLEPYVDNLTNGNCFVYIVNPNNPLGVIHKLDEIKHFVNSYKSAKFIVDEAYIEFTEESLELINNKSAIGLVHDNDNVFITRTFSKMYGLAGIRLGYLVAHPKTKSYIQNIYNEASLTEIAKLSGIFIHSNLKYYNLILKRIRDNRNKLQEFFEKFNIFYYPSHANFITFYIGNNFVTLDLLLKDNNIYFRLKPNDDNMFGFARITIGTEEHMEKVMKIFSDNIELFKPYKKTSRCFIDGCFDGYHYGHVNALFQSKNYCDLLIAGTHSDTELEIHKGECLFNYEERIFMLKSCRFINFVVSSVPYITSIKTIDENNCDYFLHGDENILTKSNSDPLYLVKKSNRYKTYSVTQGISTTNLLNRIIQYSYKKHITTNNNTEYLLNILNNIRKTFDNNDYNNCIFLFDSWDLLCSKHILYLQKIKSENKDTKIIACVSADNSNCIYNQLERAITLSSLKDIDMVICEDIDEIRNNTWVQIPELFNKSEYILQLIHKINNSPSLTQKYLKEYI